MRLSLSIAAASLLLACGGKVTFDGAPGSGGAGGAGSSPSSSTSNDTVATGPLTGTTGTGELSCGNLPPTISDCGGGSASSGGDGTCLTMFYCTAAGDDLMASCTDGGCACFINGVSACSCAISGDGDICAGTAQPCCPFSP